VPLLLFSDTTQEAEAQALLVAKLTLATRATSHVQTAMAAVLLVNTVVNGPVF